MVHTVKYLFLVLVFISLFTNQIRCDYNLFLFIFSFVLWDKDDSQKQRLISLMMFSWFVDLLWIILFPYVNT